MASRRRVIRPSGDKDVVFKRGREGEDVFDDSELIEAWNKQLQRMQEEGERKPLQFPLEGGGEGKEDENVIEFKSDRESSQGSGEAESSNGSGSASSVVSNGNDAQPVTSNFEPTMPPGISTDLQNLLRSWYQAGYHMGTFVANSKKN